MSLLDVLPEKDRNRLEFLINRGRNPHALDDLTRALSVVEADPELSAKATGERWNLRVYWDKSPIGKIPLMEIYPNENYGHPDWQSCFSNADYFVTLGAPDRLGYDFYDHVADIRELTGRALSSQKDKAAREINRLVSDLKKGTGKTGGSTWKIHSPVTNLHFEEGIMKNKKPVAEDHGSELLTVIDAVELADSLTKAGRPFYIDTDHEAENGLDVWAVNSKTGEDYPRSWRVMDDLSVFVYNTDKNGNADVVEEKSFGNIHELGAWLAKEFANLAGKTRESKGRRNERGDSHDEYTANVILQADKGSGTTDLEYEDDTTYLIHIGMDELTKALRKAGAPEELLDGENVMQDINDALSYHDDIGWADVATWYSPSQSFEDPGEGGGHVTLHLNAKDRWGAIYGAIRTALQVYALGVLELFGSSNGNFIERGEYEEADIPDIMKEVEASPELQDSLKELGLTNDDVEKLLKAAIDPRTAVDPGNLIINLDGEELDD